MSRGLATTLFSLLFLSQFAGAQATKPLSLKEALRAADLAHPDLTLIESEVNIALADRDIAASRQDFTVNFEAGLRYARPTLNSEQNRFIDDNNIRVNARKNLFDFGRTRFAEDAALEVVNARRQLFLDARERRRIEIMARFFDVLLADLRATADNEYRSIAYVNFDNAKHRHELGVISNVQLSEAAARDQQLGLKQSSARKEQRAARARLANAMNRPGELPLELEEPDLNLAQKPTLDYQALLPIMWQQNPRLKAQQNLLAASLGRLDGGRAEASPTVEAELEAGKYSRKLAARDELRAGVVLNWPIYQGSRITALTAREQAQFQKLQAEFDKLKLNLSQALLEVLLEIEHLQKAGRESAKSQVRYRDMALERARAEYEMEIKTNLGDSMAATVEAKLAERKNEYQLALLFAELDVLLGQPVSVLGEKTQ